MVSALPLFGCDPASAFSEFEQILLSNSGEDAFESAVKLLAAKLMAEIEAGGQDETKFRIYQTPEATNQEIEELFRKAVCQWPALNGAGSSLDISPAHLVRSLRPLLGWSLLGSDLSHLDAALERLVARSAKGEMGQYFTPRDVIRFCVQVLHPNPDDVLIDPACGSAGFLFEASRQAVAEFSKPPRCLGIDFGAKAAKVATLLATAARDFEITITKANSLDGRDYVKAHPPEWDLFADEGEALSDTLTTWGAWSRLRCSLLFTNPPFAGDIDDAPMVAAYEAPRSRVSKKSISREHLFLERAVRLLRPGGRMAIVLPQGLFSNSSAAYLRQWLFSKVRVLGVVSLHQFTFLPNTGVKTSILFAERKTIERESASDYSVFFAASRRPGKDSSGRSTEPADYSEIAAAFMTFLSKEGLPWAKCVSGPDRPPDVFDVVKFQEVVSGDRLDAEFYDPHARRLLKRMRREARGSIRDYTDAKSIERFRARNHDEISYIDISSVDPRTGLVTPGAILASEAPSRASYLVRPGDVLVSTVRPDRGVVALVTDFGGATLVASNGFCVLRAKDVEPEFLFAFCKSNSFRALLVRAATASMYPTVTESDILDIPLPLPPPEIRASVCAEIQRALVAIRSSYHTMETAIGSLNEL